MTPEEKALRREQRSKEKVASLRRRRNGWMAKLTRACAALVRIEKQLVRAERALAERALAESRKARPGLRKMKLI